MTKKSAVATSLFMVLALSCGVANASPVRADVPGSFVVADIPPPQREVREPLRPPRDIPVQPVPKKPDSVVPPVPAPKPSQREAASPFRWVVLASGVFAALAIALWWRRGRVTAG